jgi:hypothetical protein
LKIRYDPVRNPVNTEGLFLNSSCFGQQWYSMKKEARGQLSNNDALEAGEKLVSDYRQP